MNPRKHIFVLIIFLIANLQVEAAYGAGGEAAGPYARYELGKDSENKMRHADIDGNMVELNDPKYYEKTHIIIEDLKSFE
ncbi:MAG: hypothetical protein IPP37_04540 [Saprospiraceae bacterium]|nr:hypothetical protein [Saprospiraceae bacterium]